MARRHRHEEHSNHEAWAIPYGDLITLLLAFFVVMYAISTVNEGKYRALSDSLSSAFTGAPHTIEPIAVGAEHPAASQLSAAQLNPQGSMIGQHASLIAAESGGGREQAAVTKPVTQDGMTSMDTIVGEVEASMAELIEKDMLKVRRTGMGVEIEIRTDILFPSGSATMAMTASGVLVQLAATLKKLPYPVRVEGHTDNRPISTTAFHSNWELSAARAASVVRLFSEHGVDPSRMAVIGLGEFRPIADNNSEAGRNLNRRVMVVILSNGVNAEAVENLNR